MLVEFLIGDWSNDGHGQCKSEFYEVNLSLKKLTQAYNEGCKIVGFDLSKDCCERYEDSKITWEKLQNLRAAGFTGKLEGELSPKEDGAYLDTETFTEIWLFIAKLGNNKLEAIRKKPKTTKIPIGGYGLFYN